jgi:hypothetical protein
VIAVLLSSCQITENLTINEDGSGSIQMTEIQTWAELYAASGRAVWRFYKDSTYVFAEYIVKYNSNFIKYTPEEQALFSMYKR